jgi:hypothetical protein
MERLPYLLLAALLLLFTHRRQHWSAGQTGGSHALQP